MIIDIDVQELISELAARAVFFDLTEDIEDPEQALKYFEEKYMHQGDNGDYRYNEDTQDLYNQYHDYYEASVYDILKIELEE